MSGLEQISQERQRQINKEGYTPDHDQEHNKGQLSIAAAAYLVTAYYQLIGGNSNGSSLWPWEQQSFKPSDDVMRNLEKAGALIAAEIDALSEES